MGFLAPLFFAALAALAIPVLVHLTHKERKEPIVFPSLMFLQRIPFKTHRRQRIRNWLLFVIRASAVALLAFAFARPFLEGRPTAAGKRSVVILLDRSASMGARGRWARAADAAREIVGAWERGSVGALIAFDDQAEVLVEPTEEAASITAALGRVRPGSAAARIAPALQTADALLERAGGGGEIVLISDFQRAGWDGRAVARLAGGVTLRTVDVGDTAQSNVAVVGAVLDRTTGSDPRTTISARLAASGGAPRDVAVQLAVDGRAVQTVTARVTPGGAAIARFAPLRDPDAVRRGTLTIPGDDQVADNTWHVLLGPEPRLTIVVITRGDAASADAVYLRDALGVATTPSFEIIRRTGSAGPADLNAAAAVILHDAPFPAGPAGRRLLDFVNGGGGLFIALGARGTLPSEIADSLGALTRVVDRGEFGGSLAVSDRAHPVFANWGGPADVAGVRAFRYRRLEKAARAPARFDDGAPALAELTLGSGRVLVWTADFANRWSDLPLHPSFVPIIHGGLRYLTRFEPEPDSRTVGDVVSMPRKQETGKRAATVDAPDGTRQVLDEEQPRFVLRQRGFYSMRGAGSRDPVMHVAANVPPAESDPARVTPEEVTRAVAPDATLPTATRAGFEAPADRERGQRLWWYILAAVLLLLAAETAIAHRERGAR